MTARIYRRSMKLADVDRIAREAQSARAYLSPDQAPREAGPPVRRMPEPSADREDETR